MSKTIEIGGQYARLSRGKICAKHTSSGIWGEKSTKGTVVLDRPGKWMISQNDGFSRKETIYIMVVETPTGDLELKEAFGSRSRFFEVEW